MSILDVYVYFAGHSLRRVSEGLADDLHGHSCGEEQRARRVTKFVNGPRTQPRASGDVGEPMPEVGRVEGGSERRGEDET